MHDQTVRDLIEGGTAIVGTLLKEQLVHKNEIQMMKERKEKEVELAEVKRERMAELSDSEDDTDDDTEQLERVAEQVPSSGGVSPTIDSDDPLDESMALYDQLDDSLAEARENETCSFCLDVLEGAQTAQPATAHKALEELNEYKELRDQLIEDGASQEEMSRRVGELTGDFEAIPKVLD